MISDKEAAKKPSSLSHKKKRGGILFLAFLIPVLIMVGVFAANEIFPFGDNCFLRTDLYHQYAMFFSEFQDKLQNGGSLLYSWDIGAGTNFVSLYAYYLASPINWLTFLIAKEYLIEWISFLAIFKIGLCSLTFTWYLSKKFDSDSLFLPLFGFAYALSAYMAAYSWNIMWLDCLLLAPLILHGLEKLVREHSCRFYCITLALCILTNYYISIMVCIFLVLYFLVLLVEMPFPSEPGIKVRTIIGLYLKKCGLFALYSLLAGGMAAILLIPEVMALGSTASGSTTFPTSLTNYFSVLEMLARHSINVTCEVGLDHWPNIYCGCAVLFLVPLYFMDKEISWKEKAAKGALIAFLLFSFSYNIPNYIWHGFHYPNSLPCRQSFLYTALLLTMCCQTVLNIRKTPARQISRSFWIAVLFLLICDHVIDVDDFSDYTFFLTFVFMAVFALFTFLYKTFRKGRSAVLCLSYLVLAAELAINTYNTSVTTVSRSGYWKNYDDYQTLIAEMDADEDSGLFYRAEKDSTTRRSKDDGAWLLYRSASVFSSEANSDVTALYKKLGLEASTNAYSTNGLTPVTASLLGIRYIFSTNPSLNTSVYSYYDGTENLYAYENPYALSLGWTITEKAFESLDNLSGNPIENQNTLLYNTTGVSGVYEELTGQIVGNTYTLQVEQSGFIYAYSTNTSVDKISASIGTTTKTFSNVKRGFLLDLGYCEAGTTITLTNSDNIAVTAVSYILNTDKLEKAMNVLALDQWELDTFEDTYVSGQVTASQDGYMIVTIPYEKGWTVTVDGETVECSTWKDAFFAVPVSAGTHTVTFTYEPDGLRMGVLISVASLLIFLILLLLDRRKRTRLKKAEADRTNIPVLSEVPQDELDHVITIDDLPEQDPVK